MVVVTTATTTKNRISERFGIQLKGFQPIFKSRKNLERPIHFGQFKDPADLRVDPAQFDDAAFSLNGEIGSHQRSKTAAIDEGNPWKNR